MQRSMQLRGTLDAAVHRLGKNWSHPRVSAMLLADDDDPMMHARADPAERPSSMQMAVAGEDR